MAGVEEFELTPRQREAVRQAVRLFLQKEGRRRQGAGGAPPRAR